MFQRRSNKTLESIEEVEMSQDNDLLTGRSIEERDEKLKKVLMLSKKLVLK